METLLQFFSNLILFTAGVVVVILWIALFIAVGVEVYDGFKEKTSSDEGGEE